MGRLLPVVFLLLVLVSPAFGQAGYISIFGDHSGIDCGLPDVAPGLATYYIFHHATPGATACQFWAPTPWCMDAIYLQDTIVFPVTLGDSQTGVSIGYGSCLAGPIHVLSILAFGQGLTPKCCCYFIYPHPASTTGDIQVVDCEENLLSATGGLGYFNPDYIECGCWISAPNSVDGLYGCINDPIPVKDVTWGKVKALYAE